MTEIVEGPQFNIEKYRPKTLRRFTFQDMELMAEHVVKSRLFKGIDNVSSAMTLMLLCDAEGLHPIQALRRYDIIDGRPALKSGAMLGDFQSRGGKVKWITLTDVQATAEFHASGLIEPVTVTYSIDDARKAGLLSKTNWMKYPKDMLKARVITRGINLADPAILGGMHSPEEVQDYDSKPVPTEVEILPPATPAIKHNGPLDEHLKQAKKNRETGLVSALSKSNEIAAEVNAMELPIEEKLELIKKKNEEELAKLKTFKNALPQEPLSKDHPTTCKTCDALILFYKSTQTAHLGRYYAQCQFAHDTIEKSIQGGMPLQKAHQAMSGHYRKWAEPPVGRAEPTPADPPTTPGDSSTGDATNAPS